MKYKQLTLAAGILLVSANVAFANPVNDLEKGESLLTVHYGFSNNNSLDTAPPSQYGINQDSIISTDGTEFSGKGIIDTSFSNRVADNIVLRASYQHNNWGKITNNDGANPWGDRIDMKQTSYGVDFIYAKDHRPVTPYVGYVHSKLKHNTTTWYDSMYRDNVRPLPHGHFKSSNIVRVGVIASTNINEKLRAWTDLSIGTKHYRNITLALSQDIGSNFTFDVGYRYQQIGYDQKLEALDYSVDSDQGVITSVSTTGKAKTKSWFLGTSYKF